MGKLFEFKFKHKLQERKIAKARKFVNNYITDHDEEADKFMEDMYKNINESLSDAMVDALCVIAYENRSRLSTEHLSKLVYIASVLQNSIIGK